MLSEPVRKQMFDTPWGEFLSFLFEQGHIPRVEKYNPNRQFGVEIEIEGRGFPDQVLGWVIHNEGSLRGEAREYVTNGPMSENQLQDALDRLKKQFKEFGTKVLDTYRASTHIHYNVQHKSLDHILKAVIAFICFEPLIVNLSGPERDGNLFCLPSYDCGDTVSWFSELLKHLSGRNKEIIPFGLLARGKYSALNTDSLTRFGTLECRVFPSTIDPKKILSWCSWINKVLGEPHASISEYVKTLEGNFDQEVLRIFGKDTPLPLHARSLLGFGVEQAWPLAVLYERAVK